MRGKRDAATTRSGLVVGPKKENHLHPQGSNCQARGFVRSCATDQAYSFESTEQQNRKNISDSVFERTQTNRTAQ